MPSSRTKLAFFYRIVIRNIPESARWLYVEGKSKECVKILNKIAVVNNSKLKPETEKELLSVKKQKSSSSFGPLALFTGARLAFNTILLLLLWVFVSICYSVLILSTGEKSDSNPFIQFSIQALAEIPSNFIGAWLCNNIGRRRSASASFFVIGTIWIIVALRQMTSIEWLRAWWISAALITIGRLTIAVSFFAINLLNMEIYPTCLRQSGLALGNVLSSVASALAPYILYLGRRVDPRLPGLILGTSCLLSVFISMFLPETLNAKLPETIEDAKVFGSKRTQFSKVSCEIQRTEDFS
ncbi:solute carrier family 22 member 15-like isoform X4 [Pieris brassicae]|uniref:solute carrier family 22 member 15-like isoform X4 n=1 Tax=Pieris brassicae TaxID=7116 RepID=UPI001E66081F|nr:solute carrier family 22 member 15-like isoform X4 [Pieris brassicae]